jgi:hypothetical protein
MSFTSCSLLDFCYFYYTIQLVQLQQQLVIRHSVFQHSGGTAAAFISYL